MAFIPTPNAASAEVRFTVDGQNVENRMVFTAGSDFDASMLGDLADIIADSWATNALPLQTADLTFREVYCVDLSDAAGPVATSTTGLPAVGGASALGVPNNVSLCFQLRTAARGRSFRGRLYPCGMRADKVANSVWDSAYAGLWEAALEQLKIDAFAGGYTWAVQSLKANKVPRVTGVTTVVANITTVDLIVDSQRRRLPGRGA